MLRRAVVASVLTLGLLLIAAPIAATGPTPEAPARVVRPDLRMARPASLTICATPTSGGFMKEDCPPPTLTDRWLRFDSVIMNVGPGVFRMRASRPSVDDPEMTVAQLLDRSDGSTKVVPSGATVHWGQDADGHPHWHTAGVERYRLFRVPSRLTDGGRVGIKRGYCFYDGDHVRPWLPGSPTERVFHASSCGRVGESEDDLELLMGISVGWADEYSWDFAGQRIPLRNVPDGRYLVCLTADPNGHFREADETNNESWARIRIVATTIRVLKRGVGACQAQVPYPIRALPPPS